MLCNKRENEYGAISNGIRMDLTYTKRSYRKGQEITAEVHKTVSLGIDPEFEGYDGGCIRFFEKLMEFQQNANKILRTIHRLLKSGQYLEFSISVFSYEHVKEYMDYSMPSCPLKSTIRQLTYNEWIYKGDGQAEGDGYWEGDKNEPGGIYLVPDARYTDERHDMVINWGQDILKALAESGI